ncbi:hypothetical protein AUK15_00600 [Candidatus Nomurabacteria bacterium CG2_30_43_9]|uniref:SMC-Scp complex subunit ScpB n=1 Tax=Candidatus Nomurabacteria bacterium CG2_30_43_9 TaxID=1805283 RepID=A0A1J5G1T5_9BACT|nr:MAG: hypothetical protein AUK15_00600 [Candidatus Nomurabacteria bacterium CG2_30_43_9]
MELPQKIEALLFFKGEPVTAGFLAKTLNVSEDEALAGLVDLEQSLSGHGIILMKNGEEYMLASSPEMGTTIEGLLKEELSKELGKAGLETLATVLYRGPISRSEINYLRGVNSNYILRVLLVRGLIEKVDHGGRSTSYQPTFELLSYIGVSKASDLPEYEGTNRSVEEFKKEAEKENGYEEE